VAHDFQADIDAIQRIDAVPTILDVVCRTTGMGFAAVARVTEDRWVTCSALDNIHFGLEPGSELVVHTTICNEIRQSRRLVAIDHVARDQDYAGHPTAEKYGFQSYISVPILLKDGTFFGTLCAIDPQPRKVSNPQTIGMFQLFAELISAHLETGHRLATSEAELIGERKVSELREQFIAVLGHDLRNPLAAIGAGAALLLKRGLDDRSRSIVSLVQGSVVRMHGLINNMLDFARGRLGEGLTIERGEETVEPILRQVIDEMRAVWPDRAIESRFALTEPVRADRARLAQLFSNLLSNALTHGKPTGPVRVAARAEDRQFELSVTNEGEPIPEQTQSRMFEPYYRGVSASGRQGLGLGLFIAAEIARAHGGTLTVSSTPAETCFTFRMPAG
jgi:signal transduction histidine kinase